MPVRRAAPPAAGPTPRRRRWAGRLSAVLAAAVLAVSGGGWGALHGVGRALGRVDALVPGHRPARPGPVTFLLVGTDDRAGVPEELLKETLHAGGEPCHCTDAMLLVQLPAPGGRLSVVSLPRDSYVEIPAHQDRTTGRALPAGPGKINAAFGMGGATLTVRTVEQATGVHVDHYLQMDFLGFVSAVDAVGGVTVCSDKPLRDEYSGLDLPAGTSRLDGVGALKYVRARHLDTDSDLSRMRRQQRLLAELLHRALGDRSLADPARLVALGESVLASVTVDRQLSDPELLALATRLRGLSAGDADFATVPLAELDHQVPGWGSTVRWDRARAAALFDALRAGRPIGPAASSPAASSPAPPTAGPSSGGVSPALVRVQVLNASGVAGLGGRVDARLRGAGFATSGLAANAVTAQEHTEIHYDPHWDESARTLAATLPQARLVKVPGQGPTLQVLIGTDYRGPGAEPSTARPGRPGRPGPAPTPSPTASAQPTAGAASPAGRPATVSTGAELDCP
ncbi:LCP family protein [Kitasatospora sp. NPDC052896]|uniref:LCP family protein n=1 Tax=Kitasatospora sp. NPDC052896 TaxID=3364061 RepID=UPI0037CB42D6